MSIPIAIAPTTPVTGGTTDLPSVDVHVLVTVSGGMFQGEIGRPTGKLSPGLLGPPTVAKKTPPDLVPEGGVRSPPLVWSGT